MSDDNFMFNLPVDIVKSSDENEMRIGGYASTSTEDRQGDEILQRGIDYSDFVDYGYFNYDHDNSKILGYPDKSKCKIDGKGFYVEGVLLKGVELAKTIWDTAVALAKSGAPRKLGFSVEGKVLKRNAANQIVKAKIYNVAITANPVNPQATWDALVKSFTNNQADIDECDKSLEAGYSNQEGGGALVPEDLEAAFKTLSYAIGDNPEAQQHMAALKSMLSTRTDITKSELVLYLQLIKGLSLKTSSQLADQLLGGKTDV